MFGETTFFSNLCRAMHGMFAIIRKKATKFRIEKIPATMYSWNTALIVNVIKRQIWALRPERLHGK